MSVTPGHHRILASNGKYLTLVTQNGVITAMPPSGSNNQIWHFQLSGTRYTIQNITYATNTYAHSNGQEGAPVTGSPLSTEWAIYPASGYGNDTSKACSVGPNDQVTLGPTQFMNPAQQFSIE